MAKKCGRVSVFITSNELWNKLNYERMDKKAVEAAHGLEALL